MQIYILLLLISYHTALNIILQQISYKMVVFGLMRDLAQKELSEYLDKYAGTKVKIVYLQVLSVNQRPLKRYAVLTHFFIVLYQYLQVVTFEFFHVFSCLY